LFFQAGVGINIESDRLSIAYLKASLKGLRLAAHAVYPLEKEDPVREKTEAIRKFVGEFLMKNRILSADIFLGIPRDLTILRYIELPIAVKENLRGTLRYEMEKYVPLSVEEIYFDCQIIEEDKEAGKLKILLIAVKKELIDPYIDLANHLGAGISGIEINSTAIANYLSYKPDTPNGDTFAIVCLGNEYLELNLVREKFLNYSRCMEIDEKEVGPHSLILRELRLLRKALGQEQGPLEVVFCGTDADSVIELIRESEDTGLCPVKLSGTGIPSDILAPAYGLALKGIQKLPTDINLLPVNLRKKAGRIGYYAMFVLSGLLILSILAWGGGGILHRKLVMNRLDSEIKRLGSEVAAVDRLQAGLKELEDRIDYVNALRRSREPVLNILRDLSREIPESAWVSRITFSDKGVEIDGYAASASDLISLLEAAPLFKDVAFLSPITKGKDGKEKFRIGFKVAT